MIRFITTSPEQTEKFGREFAKFLCGGDVIALTGDLGAGKTCLTRGIADGLGSNSHVSSPTFTPARLMATFTLSSAVCISSVLISLIFCLLNSCKPPIIRE